MNDRNGPPAGGQRYCPKLARFEFDKSNHLPRRRRPTRATAAVTCDYDLRDAVRDEHDLPAATACLAKLLPVIHTINASLIMGLEGRRVRVASTLHMSTTLIEICRAKASDAVDVATTHDQAWRTAYQGIIPGNELDKLINRRGPDWSDRPSAREAASPSCNSASRSPATPIMGATGRAACSMTAKSTSFICGPSSRDWASAAACSPPRART